MGAGSDRRKDPRVKKGLIVCAVDPFHSAPMLVQLAETAEARGWDGFFITDHIVYRQNRYSGVADSWLSIAAIAASTKVMTVGVMVAPLPRYRPWDVASHIISLDQLAPGRIVIGVGLGSTTSADFECLGPPLSLRLRVEMFDESLSLVKRFLLGEHVTSTGGFFPVNGVQLTDSLADDDLWCGGIWPGPSVGRARRCDGYFPEKTRGYLDLDEIKSIRRALDETDDRSLKLIVERQPSARRNDDSLERAGVAWCLDYVGWREHTYSEAMNLIQLGPANMHL